MYIAVRDGRIDQQNDKLEPLLKLDPTKYEVFEWDEPLPVWHPELDEERPRDPRTAAQKASYGRERYLQRRLREYPPILKQLDMMYWDVVNGTNTWVDTITAIKEKHPKPE